MAYKLIIIRLRLGILKTNPCDFLFHILKFMQNSGFLAQSNLINIPQGFENSNFMERRTICLKIDFRIKSIFLNLLLIYIEGCYNET